MSAVYIIAAIALVAVLLFLDFRIYRRALKKTYSEAYNDGWSKGYFAHMEQQRIGRDPKGRFTAKPDLVIPQPQPANQPVRPFVP